MKKVFIILCLILLLSQVGCSKKETENKISFCNTNGISFMLKDNNLYSWADTDEKLYVLDKTEILQVEDIDDFIYQDDNNLASYEGYNERFKYKMLYVLKKDGTFWMRGYNEYVPKRQKHNYKELTKVMDNVSAFYTRAGRMSPKSTVEGPSVYVLKNDNSLWCWEQQGTVRNNRIVYDFFKVMDDVQTVTVGGNIDYAIKTDGSLWSINVFGFNFNDSPYANQTQKLIDNIKICKVDYTQNGDHNAYAIDEENNLWAWGILNSKLEEFHDPKVIMKDVEDVLFLKSVDDVTVADQYALKKDGSIWLLTEAVCSDSPNYMAQPRNFRETPLKIFSGLPKKIHVVNPYYGMYVLDSWMSKLWQYQNGQWKEIDRGVKDFLPVLDGKSVWILKKDNTLVDQNGTVHLDNVDGIYTNDNLFDEGIATSGGKVYSLKVEGVEEVFSIE